MLALVVLVVMVLSLLAVVAVYSGESKKHLTEASTDCSSSYLKKFEFISCMFTILQYFFREAPKTNFR